MDNPAEKTLSYIYDLISEGIWDWNLLTGRIDRHAAWLTMLGYADSEFQNNITSWQNFIHPDDRAKTLQSLDDYLSAKTSVYKIRYRCKKSDGSFLWIEDSGAVVEHTSDGKPARMMGVYTDINDKWNLEQLVAKRTKELELINKTLEQKLKQVEHNASFDIVTGIFNRRVFESRLKQEIGRAARYDYALSIILLDIDKFKSFNDNYGHSVGDEILRKLANLLSENVRNYDIVARWGGEEFAIILPNTTKTQAAIKAEKLRTLIVNNLKHDNQTLTCSFGVSTLEPSDNSNSIFIRADKALYLAKDNNRNNVKVI